MKKGSPQVEDGFTKIADEMLEAMALSLPAPGSILIAVIRMTWGFDRKQAAISNKKMCELTGVGPTNINRDIKKAISAGYISLAITSDGRHGRVPVYSVQKRYLKWFKPSQVKVKSLPSQVKNLTITSEDTPYIENTREKRKPIGPPTPKKATPKRKTQIDPNFELTNKRMSYALDRGFAHELIINEFEKFKAHHTAHGKLMKDWNAAWQYWVRNIKTINGSRPAFKSKQARRNEANATIIKEAMINEYRNQGQQNQDSLRLVGECDKTRARRRADQRVVNLP